MQELVRQDGTFNFWYPAVIEKSSDGKMWVSGIASTEHEDLQGERIKQDGLELSYFLKRGFLNDDHQKDTGAKVGIPTEALLTKKGLWIKGYLLDTGRAKAIYELAQALNKSGDDRKLGFSVEGKVLSRDEKNPRIITKAWVKDIAITASPINPNTFMDIAKSFASADCTKVFVSAETEEEAITKGEKKKSPDVLAALEESTKKPVVDQNKVEKKDALVTEEALRDPGKPDLEKELDDVPVAKRAFKSVQIYENEDGDIVIKGFKLPQNSPGSVEATPEGEDVEDTYKKNDKFIKEGQDKTQKTETKKVEKNKTEISKKSENSTDLLKAFTKVHELGGERQFGDKRIPVHATTYRHKKSGHHILVTSKDGAHSITHMHKSPDECETEVLGGHIFHDDSDKGVKGEEGADAHLRGFGITHNFKDGKRLLGKSIIAAGDDNNSCEICSTDIQKGNLFLVQEGHVFCGDDCIEKGLGKCWNHPTKQAVTKVSGQPVCEDCADHYDGKPSPIKDSDGRKFSSMENAQFSIKTDMDKALVAGYSFGKTDQVGGSALRVESLEGSQTDLAYGQKVLHTDVKNVQFGTPKANGGSTYVTLKDALEFLMNRGFPEDMASRILVLMVKNEGDFTKLASKAKQN